MQTARFLTIFCGLFIFSKINAQTAFDYFEKGKQMHSAGKINEAIAYYDECLSLDSKFAEAFYNRASANFTLGYYHKSIDDFTKVAELHKKDPEVFARIANSFYMLGKYEKSIENYEKSLKIAPNSAVLVSASIVAQSTGNQNLAIEYAEKALELNPENPRAWAAKAAALSKNNQIETALAAWKEADQRDPNNPELKSNIGACLCKMGFWKEATGWLNQSLELEANSVAFLNRSRCFLETEKIEAARQDAEAALQMSVENSADVYNMFGLIFAKNNHLDSALIAFNNAIGWEPGHSEAIYNRSQAYFQLGFWKEAERDLDILITRKSKEGRVFYARARARYDLGEWDGACADFKTAQTLGLPEISNEYQISFCRN